MATLTPEQLGRSIDHGERAPVLPATLTEPQGLALCELLRLVPGKRAVFRGRWTDRPVLVKWYQRAGSRQFERESRGADRLRRSGLPAAALLHRASMGAGHLLIFQWLEGESLAQLWRDAPADSTGLGDDQRRALALLAEAVAGLRRAGLRQGDLHFDNFMVTPDTACPETAEQGMAGRQQEGCAVIDVASIVPLPDGNRGRTQFRRDLAMLAAQVERERQHSVCRELGQLLGEPDLDGLCEQAWRKRRGQFLRKCFRETTAVQVDHSWRRYRAVRRSRLGPELEALLAEPDLATAGCERLKDGGSSTVFRLVVDGRPLVVKRYNLKSRWHRLKRALQSTRAARSWRNSHHLELLGYPTAAPVAMLEERWGPFRGRAWFIAEAVAAAPLLEVWRQRQPTELEALNVRRWFRLAALERLVHGDLKATNWLVDADGHIHLIDLDAMHRVRWRWLWKRRDRAERRRFLANWNDPRYQRVIDTGAGPAGEGGSR